jgi:hypothetical protein
MLLDVPDLDVLDALDVSDLDVSDPLEIILDA